MVKERRGGGAATVWAKVQAVFSTLTPPAARAAGVHFGQARIPILKRSSGVSLGCSAITATFLFLRIYTQTRRPRRGSCRDVTAAGKKAKASLNLEESRSGGYSSVYGPVLQ